MVYLLHFSSPHKHARHYLGFCKENNLEKRMSCHKHGRGSKLVKYILSIGIKLYLVAIWKNKDGFFERKIKNMKNTPTICPICNPSYNGIYKEGRDEFTQDTK